MSVRLVPYNYQYVPFRQRRTGDVLHTHQYRLTRRDDPNWTITVNESRGTDFNLGRGFFTSKHFDYPAYSNLRLTEDNRLVMQRYRRSQLPENLRRQKLEDARRQELAQSRHRHISTSSESIGEYFEIFIFQFYYILFLKQVLLTIVQTVQI